MNIGKVPEEPKVQISNQGEKSPSKLNPNHLRQSVEQRQLSSLESFFQLPPGQVVKQLNRLLRSDQPESQKLLEFMKINIDDRQKIFLAALACLKDLFKINLTKEEEEEIFKAIEEEQEENSEEKKDPEQKKKRQARRKASLKRRKERSNNKKYRTDLLLDLLDRSVKILEKRAKLDLQL